jgi:hypothetical protein
MDNVQRVNNCINTPLSQSLHLNSKAVYKHCTSSACYLLHARFLLDLFINPEDIGNMFL